MDQTPNHPDQNAVIHVGPAGWAYDDWKGIVYPATMPRSQHPLALLSEWFDTVELNVTFYRLPDAKMTGAWLRHIAGNPAFQFTAKLWQGFTHESAETPEPAAVAAYCAGLRPLRDAGRLGPLLAQFPMGFHRTPENRVRLARLADAFEGWPLAVEVRHASWDHPDFYRGLEERGVALCAVDQPALRGCLPPSDRVTAPLAYIRLHGRNAEHWFRAESGRNDRYNYLYSPGEIAEWGARAREMARKTKGLFLITNNHYRGQAVANALELRHALALPRVPVPHWLLSHYPALKKLLEDPH